MLFILKTVIILLSLGGYALYLQKKGIELAFCPVITISGIGIAMFLAGLLHIMPFAVWGILLGGILCGFIARKQLVHLSTRDVAVLLFWLLVSTALGIFVKDTVLNSPDDFSHWALVVKNMLMDDALPNSQSRILYYASYPTGTAGILYYICKILGHTEPVMLYGQILMLSSCLCVLWAFVKRVDLASIMAVCGFSLYMLYVDDLLLCLLVDTLLGLLAVSSFAVLIYYRHNLTKGVVLNCVIAGFMTLVKNSSFFYTFLNAALVFCLVWLNEGIQMQPKKLLGHWKILAAAVLTPIVVYSIWNWHIEYAFTNADMTRHSLSADYLALTFTDKGIQDIKNILVRLALRCLKVGWEFKSLLIFLMVYLTGFLLRYRGNKRLLNIELAYLMWGAVAIGAYVLSLAGMYLFSMPIGEALHLSSYERYMGTTVIYLTGVFCVYFFQEWKFTVAWRRGAAVFLVVLLLLSNWGNYSSLMGRNPWYYFTDRSDFQRIVDEYEIPSDSSYYVLSGETSVLIRFIIRYEFLNNRVMVEEDPRNPQELDGLPTCEYLIVMPGSEGVEEFLTSQGLPLGQEVYYLPDYR